MIRTICMFYNNSRIEVRDKIAAFFRLAGLYVSERFYNLDGAILKNLAKVSENVSLDNTDYSMKRLNSDYNIYLLDAQNDLELLADDLKDVGNDFCYVFVNDGSVQDDDIVSKCIEYIISNMYNSKILTEDEFGDLQELNNCYDKHNIYLLLVQTSYLYPFVCKSMAGKFIEQYSVVVDGLLTILNGLGLEGWGDDKHRIIQYAALKLAADANIYSKKTSLGYLYDSEQLVDNCKLLKKTDRYGNAFVMLEGEINAYILNSNNSAYESYITLCNEEGEYNAYAYYLKGENWKNFRLNIETAVKYFLKSIEIYPLYYRAWYMLGEMYLELKQTDKALLAFKTVKLIIEPYAKKKMVLPREYSFLHRSYKRIADISMRQGKYDVALSELKKAVELWNSINRQENEYFDKTQISNEVIQAIKEGINIKYIYSQIVKIYYEADMAKEGNYYMRLLRE